MTMLRGNFGDLLAPGFLEIYNSALDFGEYGPEYPALFNVKSSTRQYEDTSYVSGFGTVPNKSEGVAVDFDDIIQGLDKRYTHVTRALAYRISKEMWEDELYGLMAELPEALGRSMRITVETDAANVYNRGFNSSYAGPDALELFSTLHVLLDGTTQKNELTNATDLTEDSLDQALIDIAATTDDRGLNEMLVPKTLVVARNGLSNAKKILMSSQEPGSANNAINPQQGVLGLQVNHYLTDPDAWFIICDKHRVNFFWRVKPEHTQDNDFKTDDAMFKTRARWVTGWSSPWGVFGSPGV